MRATDCTTGECRNAASPSSSDAVDEADCAVPDPFVDPVAGVLTAGAPVALCCAAARLGANISAATASSIASQKARQQKFVFEQEMLNGNPRQRLAERRERHGRRDRQPKLEG
jgi:hypothetical protein